MLSSVEAWRASLCALPFDGAQGDTRSLQSNFYFHSPFRGLGGYLVIKLYNSSNRGVSTISIRLFLARASLVGAGSC